MVRSYRSLTSWLLAFVMTMVQPAAWAQTPKAEDEKPTRLDLAYLTPRAFALAVIHPRRAMQSPAMEMFPIEVMSVAGKKQFGVDPTNIAQAQVFVAIHDGGPEPDFGMVLLFAKAYDKDAILSKLPWPTEEVDVDGKKYLRPSRGGLICLYFPDDTTLVLGKEEMVRDMIAGEGRAVDTPLSRLAAKLTTADDAVSLVTIEPIRDQINAALSQTPPLPPALEEFKQAPNLLDYVALRLNLQPGRSSQVIFRATDEAAAEKLEQMANSALDMGRQMFLEQMAQDMTRGGDPEINAAMQQYMQRITAKLFAAIRPVRDGDRLTITSEASGQMNTATIGILVALLLPGVQAAREAARRNASINNMKMIGIGMLNFHDVHRKYPARANFDKDGNPLLSWRVHILPYMEEKALYDEFHLDEPWNSEHNRKLIERMPDFYQNPNLPAIDGTTNYLAITGEGTLFDGTEGKSIANIADGTVHTMILVEANPERAVAWTKPDDLEIDADRPRSGLGGVRPGGFLAMFADTHVSVISEAVDDTMLNALFTIRGGEIVNLDDF